VLSEQGLRAMASLGFSDLLSVAQAVAIIAALAMTLYFSKRQMKGFSGPGDQVLNDLDEKAHDLVELFIDNLVHRVDLQRHSQPSAPVSVLLTTSSSCGHAFRKRQRGVLGDKRVGRWMQWMKNAFRYGTIGQVPDGDWMGSGSTRRSGSSSTKRYCPRIRRARRETLWKDET
jgi:hypothetical protein